MVLSSMQTTPLQISAILQYAATAHPRREIVSRQTDGPLWRYNYAALAERAGQAAHALRRLGVREGDCVSSLAWNTHRQLELFYAVPGLGGVLHTANPRLSDAQIAYTINHAGSSVLLFEPNLLGVVERLAPHLPKIREFVVLCGLDTHRPGHLGALCYEGLLREELATYDWPVFDENTGAILSYTSGTTGDPKGVLYSHRSIVLHAMGAGLTSAFGLNAFDVVMPCASLYHATAWGLPFVAPVCGAKLVLPADRMDGASLHELIVAEGVTFTGGVPTIWTLYLSHLEVTGQRPQALRRVMIGGSAVPRVMAEAFKTRYGVETLQIWGMTETCPLGVVASPTPALAEHGEANMQEVLWTRQGRLQFGIELRIVDELGEECPWDGETPGTLMVRGPWVVRRYFRQREDVTDAEGWFDTGDIATIDADGFMRITDRAKDVIKSGGEWISSIDLENAAAAHSSVRIAAVVGVPHAKWEERPILVAELHDGETLTEADLLQHLSPQVAKWWLPDAVVFAQVPLTSTGKIDKKTLRERYRTLLRADA